MDDGMKQLVFSGWLNDRQSVTETIFSLPGWTSSVLRISVIVQDVNSNTNLRYFCSDYGWYRQWDDAPKHLELARQYDYQTGDAKYTIESLANGNEIQVKISQTGLTIVTKYKILAEYMFATTEDEMQDILIHNRMKT